MDPGGLEYIRIPPDVACPKQLISPVLDFTGRRRDIARLVHLLTSEGSANSAARVVAISGAPGVGKTQLAR
jgi:Holliday junction resolvasome RuvABC ATP-dependent DNA helicase subunit